MNAAVEDDDVSVERLRVFMYGDGFAGIDGELIAARTGEQRTDSVPAGAPGRPPYLFAQESPRPGGAGPSLLDITSMVGPPAPIFGTIAHLEF